MNDAFGVGGVERVGNFDGQRENGLDLHGTPGDAALQRHTVEKLHGDEGMAVLLTDVVNGADVGMIQRGGGLRFALEAGERLGVPREFVGKELEGHEATEAGVLGLVDHAHSAVPKFFKNAVVRYGLADHLYQLLGCVCESRNLRAEGEASQCGGWGSTWITPGNLRNSLRAAVPPRGS